MSLEHLLSISCVLDSRDIAIRELFSRNSPDNTRRFIAIILAAVIVVVLMCWFVADFSKHID